MMSMIGIYLLRSEHIKVLLKYLVVVSIKTRPNEASPYNKYTPY